LAAEVFHGQGNAPILRAGRPAERGLHDGAVAILHALVAKAEAGTTEAGIQRVGLQLEQDPRLVGAFAEEAFTDGLDTTHLRQELTGQWQSPPVDPAQVVLVRTAADKGAQIVIEEIVRYALDPEELAEVGQGHFAFAVGAERIALMQ